MPLYSDLSNISLYYSGSSSYSSSLPSASSYSSSYLNPGGNFSNHSSLGGYGRAPYASRWVPTSRNYSPLLTTISERVNNNPSRLASPKRYGFSSAYSPSNYVPRPIKINTADIDVSRDRYRDRSAVRPPDNIAPVKLSTENESPFMPRVDGLPDNPADMTHIHTQSTIKRGRTVVRLHTLKRKERDSPRKSENDQDVPINTEPMDEPSTKMSPKSGGWRDKLADDLAYKDGREKKTPGKKLVEKFIIKDVEDTPVSRKSSPTETNSEDPKPIIVSTTNENNYFERQSSKSPDRRCSIELLAEQAKVLDTLIREENLNPTCLDLTNVGIDPDNVSDNLAQIGSRRKKKSPASCKLQTTQSDYSLYEKVKRLSMKELKSRKSSLKKSASGGSICRLDSILELSKEPIQFETPDLEDKRRSLKVNNTSPKQRNKITTSVEVTQSPLVARIGDITVEQKLREPKLDIQYSSEISRSIKRSSSKDFKNRISKKIISETSIAEEPEEVDNFWDVIGKRETIYITQRKEKIQEQIDNLRKRLFWCPEEEEISTTTPESEKNELNLQSDKKEIDSSLLMTRNVETLTENNPEPKKELEIKSDDELSIKLKKDEPVLQIDKGASFDHSKQNDSNENVSLRKIPSDDTILEIVPQEAVIDKDSTKNLENAKLQSSDTCFERAAKNLKPENEIKPKTKKASIEKSNIKKVSVQKAKQIVFALSKTKAQNAKIIEKSEIKIKKSSSKAQMVKTESACSQTPQIAKSESTVEIVEIAQESISNHESPKRDSKDPIPIIETPSASTVVPPTSPIVKTPVKKPVKDEPALRPLIATPRNLQKRVPQVIHSSSSSDSSSEEESEDESSDSEVNEYYECENSGLDGRTSTGSNDSGFDSSAPTSPAGFTCIKKECDVICHRKCEKLTANLCGVNQKLLVEALGAKSSHCYFRRGTEVQSKALSSSHQSTSNSNVSEYSIEFSTAYGIFKRTGVVTPPAKSIPRYKKYAVDDFHFLKVLGKGSFGKVLLAELRETEYYYAVKCLKKDVVLEDDDVECTMIERKVLALGTNHPYLCHLFATFQNDSHLFFVMEYLTGGDLMFHIQQSGRFPEARARFYASEIVSGLKFLHKRGIVYRDLKLDNILLDFEGHVRIADFGMCKLQIYLDKTADTFCGTPDYMAPEIIKGLKYTQTVDWWSFGVLLYEMLIGQSPFSGCDEDELFWSICNEIPSYPRFLSADAHEILNRLLDKEARSRLGSTECVHGDIRDQEFFRQINWDRLERRELEPPFRPKVRHPLDTQYFDRAFTGEKPRLTAVEPQVLRTMDHEAFRGFSYTNPNATDR